MKGVDGMDLLFLLNSVGLGVGLAMDAFSVSLANGLHEPRMSPRRMCAMAGTYAGFQFLMPLLGWVCVRTIAELFSAFRRAIPWIALGLLLYIGVTMLLEGLRERGSAGDGGREKRLPLRDLLLQGVATSIDALSVGFTLAADRGGLALAAAGIIALVTFALCMAGLLLGRKAGTRLSWGASVLGGCILIAIGLEIFLKGIL